jgi:hypothetical protein
MWQGMGMGMGMGKWSLDTGLLDTGLLDTGLLDTGGWTGATVIRDRSRPRE